MNNNFVYENKSIKEVIGILDHLNLRTVSVYDKANKLVGLITYDILKSAIYNGEDVNLPIKGMIKSDDKLKDNQGGYNKKNEEQKILVFGGAGYLGSVLSCRLLEKGYNVTVFDKLLFGNHGLKDIQNNSRFKLIKGDIRNLKKVTKALKEVYAVINLAALVGESLCNKKPTEAIETNCLAAKMIAEACRYFQINRFIFASTDSTYGIQEGIMDENSPLNPISLYARSKVWAEKQILSLEDDNFSPTILRMGTLYGFSHRMRFDLVINALTMHATVNKKIKVYGGKQWRPLVHVKDAAEAYIKCLEAPINIVKGEIFNVGSNDQNYQIYQLSDIIMKQFPDAIRETIDVPPDLRDYHVDFSKISKKIGYKVKYTVEDAILEIKDAIESKKIVDYYDKKYYNS